MLAKLPQPLALLLIAVIAVVAAWCVTTRPPPIKTAKKGGYTDIHLYQDITRAVVRGVPYHQAAAETQRAHHYPLKPFFTVRPPTLVMFAAWFGWKGVQMIACAIILATIMGWVIATEGRWHWIERIALGCVLAVGGGAIISPALLALHEYIGGFCISVALAGVFGWRRQWWLIMLPLALGLAIRELVLPFVLLLLAFALIERRWREALAWMALVGVWAGLMAWHGALVAAQWHAGDITSPGWHAMQGFSGFLKAVIFTSVIQPLPLGLALLVACLPIFGWMAVEGRAGTFALILLAGYIVMISAFSRPDTFYWGAIMLPWYFVGFVLLPRAVWQLAGAARGRPLPTPAFLAWQPGAPSAT